MPLDPSLKKVLILGSGPIIIGQAAEFDYSGTQACKAVREEGIETILINSNPATIMTDSNMADRVYIEPMTPDCVARIIEIERPDGILAGFGGQTALNLAMTLEQQGVLTKFGVRLLGVNSTAIRKAEDREEFKKLMLETAQPIPMSIIATDVQECVEFAEECGFPLIIRPAYTLGGTGGGIAETMEQLREICTLGITLSPIGQILLEQSVAGWKELEYEVMRDGKDNCIIICNMENIDPVGIHTGDSIVVAPSQTLRDTEYHMLRKAALDIIRSLEIKGGCNIQFALDTASSNYVVIEVNPRVSRSSALASKATGYPIAKIAAKIAVGYSLDELKNYVTGTSSACFEPALDYVVTKMPRWPFDKFGQAERTLGTQMKATGEVMAISRTFESSLMKAVTSLDGKFSGFRIVAFEKLTTEALLAKIRKQDDQRMFAIAEAMRRDIGIEQLHTMTKIDRWFLRGMQNIVRLEQRLRAEPLTPELLLAAEEMGFVEEEIRNYTGRTAAELSAMRQEHGIFPVYKMVDTCSGEFEARTPYYYSCYESEDENIVTTNRKILVVGSGPIRIGQGIEFDYCCVHGVWAIKEAGFEAIIINNNPETVSTDFDTADKLFFEPIHIDDILNVVKEEQIEGVVIQFGGQTSLNVAEQLEKNGVKILGSSFKSIDMAEDRNKLREILGELRIPTPPGMAVANLKEAYAAADKLGYPVVVRPSYVIGGRAMQIVHSRDELAGYMEEAAAIWTEHAILVDKYIRGVESDVDAICDGSEILIPGIMEHVERTGVHSGDSISVYPYFSLSEKVIQTLVDYTRRISIRLGICGLINIQYAIQGKNVYVIEVNPRASRTVPILSKVTGVPMVKLAIDAMLGKPLSAGGYGTGLRANTELIAVKVPVFSGEKLADVDITLGPEMKSTGEVLGVDTDFGAAIYKGFLAAGTKIISEGKLYVSLKDVDKAESIELVRKYEAIGFKILASQGTSAYLNEHGVHAERVLMEDATKMIARGQIQLVINTPDKGNSLKSRAFRMRRRATEYRVPVFTCLDTAKFYLHAIQMKLGGRKITPRAMQSYDLSVKSEAAHGNAKTRKQVSTAEI